MDNETYLELSGRTAKMSDDMMYNINHTQVGLCGEAGEFADAYKRAEFYGRDLDIENCKEELGDALWYIALGARTLGVTIGELMQMNIDKLNKRYPDKFTNEAAIARADKA